MNVNLLWSAGKAIIAISKVYGTIENFFNHLTDHTELKLNVQVPLP